MVMALTWLPFLLVLVLVAHAAWRSMHMLPPGYSVQYREEDGYSTLRRLDLFAPDGRKVCDFSVYVYGYGGAARRSCRAAWIHSRLAQAKEI